MASPDVSQSVSVRQSFSQPGIFTSLPSIFLNIGQLKLNMTHASGTFPPSRLHSFQGRTDNPFIYFPASGGKYKVLLTDGQTTEKPIYKWLIAKKET